MIPFICTILWKQRNRESWDSPSRIQTSNDITHQHILETYTGQVSPAHVCPKVKPVLTTRSDFSVAITTVHWFITARFKRYFGVFATLGECCGKHLALGSVTAVSVAFWLPCLAARRTALGLISIAFGLEKLLFLSVESKGSPTIGTLDRFVLKTHWMTSSLLNSS